MSVSIHTKAKELLNPNGTFLDTSTSCAIGLSGCLPEAPFEIEEDRDRRWSEKGDARPRETESSEVIGDDIEFGESAVIVPERLRVGRDDEGGGGVNTRSRRELEAVDGDIGDGSESGPASEDEGTGLWLSASSPSARRAL